MVSVHLEAFQHLGEPLEDPSWLRKGNLLGSVEHHSGLQQTHYPVRGQPSLPGLHRHHPEQQGLRLQKRSPMGPLQCHHWVRPGD